MKVGVGIGSNHRPKGSAGGSKIPFAENCCLYLDATGKSNDNSKDKDGDRSIWKDESGNGNDIIVQNLNSNSVYTWENDRITFNWDVGFIYKKGYTSLAELLKGSDEITVIGVYSTTAAFVLYTRTITDTALNSFIRLSGQPNKVIGGYDNISWKGTGSSNVNPTIMLNPNDTSFSLSGYFKNKEQEVIERGAGNIYKVIVYNKVLSSEERTKAIMFLNQDSQLPYQEDCINYIDFRDNGFNGCKLLNPNIEIGKAFDTESASVVDGDNCVFPYVTPVTGQTVYTGFCTNTNSEYRTRRINRVGGVTTYWTGTNKWSNVDTDKPQYYEISRVDGAPITESDIETIKQTFVYYTGTLATSIVDRSGKGHDLTVTGTPIVYDGGVDWGISAYGASRNQFSTNDNYTIVISIDSFNFEKWYHIYGLNRGVVQGDTSQDSRIAITNQAGAIRVISNNTVIVSSIAKNKIATFVDGLLLTAFNQSISTTLPNRDVQYIGLGGAAIKYAALYTRAFSDNEITAVTTYLENKYENYTELEYLESTGSQLIDTGVEDKVNRRFELDIEFLKPDRHLYGFSSSNLAWFGISLGCVNYCNAVTDVAITNNLIKVILDNVNGDRTFTADSYSLTTKNTVSKGTMSLFGIDNSYKGFSRVYGVVVYDSCVCTHHFIPVLDSAGTPCMYDKINKTYHYNQGSGEFLWG